ncbi:MAG: redoxin domain-containing protein [Gammaproteobacteria bacterium]|nr:redoxin domain-containing protein [Gammaproteobacteria bacterium]
MQETEKSKAQAKAKKHSSIVKRILKYAVYLLIFIIASQLGQIWLQRDTVIGKAPAIVALDIEGQPVSLANYKGKPVLLYFWATWCPICRFEHSTITSLAEDYQVLGIALQSGEASEVMTHMQEEGAVYRVINDPDGVLSARYGIRGVPTSFIIDSSGDIRATLSGFTTGLSLRYRLWRLMQDAD